jgi:hypothetical protein
MKTQKSTKTCSRIPSSKPRNPFGKIRKGSVVHKDRRNSEKDERKHHEAN